VAVDATGAMIPARKRIAAEMPVPEFQSDRLLIT